MSVQSLKSVSKGMTKNITGRRNRSQLIAAMLAVSAVAGAATAQQATKGESRADQPLSLALLPASVAQLQPLAPAAETTASTADRFGMAPVAGADRAWFFTVAAGVARDEDPGTHSTGFASLSTFLDQAFEVQLELNGYAFQQPGDDAAGVAFHFNFRWHTWYGMYGQSRQTWDEPMTASPDWTIFFDGGIGMIFSTDDVPQNGTSVNFSPRVGAGFTARLGEGSTRLVAGLRWHHISNARINGDDENPDFNAPMVYAGVQWGF